MAEGLPAGDATPDTTQNQQETRVERRQRRRDLARGATNRENTTNLETQVQGAALQQTNTAEVGTGLMGKIANFPIDIAKAGGRLAWKATKGTAKFGGRMAVGTVKYPAMGGGLVLLGGAGVAGGALGGAYKILKTPVAAGTHWAIHADKEFGEGFDMVWKPIMEYTGGKGGKK